MATLTENLPHAGSYLISEGNGDISRETVPLASGNGVIRTGTVLAKLTATGKYVPYDNAGTDGSETAAAILWEERDTTDGDVKAVVTARHTTVNKAELVWAAGVDAAGITAGLADLAVLSIIAR
ncbi:head decoration protein [Azospirillum argentinense]|uniref:Head decoration protein n=1 Tax=Azospirillum brasilense TaxID=192 RepID=A0A4D8Q8N0_AZOBR|nr:head decoration protein [Azospirillum argentinense]QCO04170.1 head decoration protein [Azospirillum argentinense]